MQKHHLNQSCFLALSLRYEINQLIQPSFDSKKPFMQIQSYNKLLKKDIHRIIKSDNYLYKILCHN